MDSVNPASGRPSRFPHHRNLSGPSASPKPASGQKRTLLADIANTLRNTENGETRRALTILTRVVEGCHEDVEYWRKELVYMTTPQAVMIDGSIAHAKDGAIITALPTFGQWATRLDPSTTTVHRDLATAARYYAVHGNLLARAQQAEAKADGSNRLALGWLVCCIATLCDSQGNVPYWENQLVYLTTPQPVYKQQCGGAVETELNPKFTAAGCGEPFRVNRTALPGTSQWAAQLCEYAKRHFRQLEQAGASFTAGLEPVGNSTRTTNGAFTGKLAI